MVFFTCSACGASLKKNQVEKHYLSKCRNCEYLTCIDCLKDFPGDTYKEHTKCITEDERYGGKNWKPKESANKGEKKQTAWIENLSELVANSTGLDSDVKELLDIVMKHENIPRKRQKFINFVKNIMRRANPSTIDKTWDLFEQAIKKKDPPPPPPKKEEKESIQPSNEETKSSKSSKKSKKKKK